MDLNLFFMEAITNDRVRSNSLEEINQQIDQKTIQHIRRLKHADKAILSQKIAELDREWDIERALEATASSFTLSGVLLGAFVNKKWLILPGVVATFLLQHAVQGWCPPVSFFRALKVRTRKEIDEEKYALKILRGDFKNISAASQPKEVLDAVKKNY